MLRTSVALSMLASLAFAGQDECRALVMSGGGSNGAWEAGVVWGLVNYGVEGDYAWDVVAGVSAGSINSSCLVGFEVGDEINASQFLVDTWSNLTSDMIYKEWPEGVLAGLTRSSFYDSSPSQDTFTALLEPFLETGYQRKMTLSAVDIENGEIVLMTEKDTPIEEIYQAVLASASVPGAFPPTLHDGRLLVDGMTAYNTNVFQAIDRCREIVDDESKITIDVLICEAQTETEVWEESSKSAFNFYRAWSLNRDSHNTNALDGTMRAHPTINWRHTIRQSLKAEYFKEIDFSPENTLPLIKAGKADAQAALAALAAVKSPAEAQQ